MKAIYWSVWEFDIGSGYAELVLSSFKVNRSEFSASAYAGKFCNLIQTFNSYKGLFIWFLLAGSNWEVGSFWCIEISRATLLFF